MLNQPVNLSFLISAFEKFKESKPFNYAVIDDFLNGNLAEILEKEFFPYDSEKWFFYKNALENKKTINDWNLFPSATYQLFTYLTSAPFVDNLSKLYGKKLYPDPGLHGGGWHIHGQGGNLNPHFDYSIHPKLGLQRTLNIIVYLSSALRPEHGGHLGLWSHDPDKMAPLNLELEVEPSFNRAIIFDTTQNSWHGMSRALVQPEGVFRKSLAIYYLCDPSNEVDQRCRALFAPRPEQEGDPDIVELIALRSGLETSKQVYKK
jgi:Rps23 Pro-64 3,4-dihydroxylase Tpa1-like proline 4-hydroxylase